MTTAVPEGYLAKVRRGERPSPEEALAFLRAWHAAHPAATSKAMHHRRLRDGRSSYDLLAACVPAGADATVVDLACGDGLLAHRMGERLGARARVVGIDASADDVALARARERPPRVTFRCEMASAMPLATASVDAVLCHYALMLFVPLEPVVAEIARVLVPGGTFAAVVPSLWSVRALSPELQARVDAMRAADLPGFPDLGLIDPRLSELGPQAFFTHAAGFEEPLATTTHTAVSSWSHEALVSSFREVYWFDLLRERTRARLLQDAARLLEPLPEPVEVRTEVSLFVAARGRAA
jgi:SAM-dependent methyltransferase